MVISGIVSTGVRGSDATISGSGFGASQGNSFVLFWPVDGVSSLASPSSWSDTEIVVPIPLPILPPGASDTETGMAGFFTVVVEGDATPGRTQAITIAADPTPKATYQYGDVVYAPAGTDGGGGGIGGGGGPGIG